jgi:hypothetical protein
VENKTQEDINQSILEPNFKDPYSSPKHIYPAAIVARNFPSKNALVQAVQRAKKVCDVTESI